MTIQAVKNDYLLHGATIAPEVANKPEAQEVLFQEKPLTGQIEVTQDELQEVNSETENKSFLEKVGKWFSDWFSDKDKVCTDGQDDGKISFKEGLQSFGKGLMGIVKSAVKHPVTTGLLVAGGVLLYANPVTGPWMTALTPMLSGLGAAFGLGMIGCGAYKAATANTDGEAKAAWETVGNGTFATVASYTAMKTGLKRAGVEGIDDMNPAQVFKKGIDYSGEVTKSLYSVATGKADKAVYIGADGFAHLTTKGKVGAQMDAMQSSNLSDYARNLNADEASQYLEFFGDYADGVVLNPNNQYNFIQAHGTMQVSDATNKTNIVSTYENLSSTTGKVIGEVAKYNVNHR